MHMLNKKIDTTVLKWKQEREGILMKVVCEGKKPTVYSDLSVNNTCNNNKC